MSERIFDEYDAKDYEIEYDYRERMVEIEKLEA